MTLIFIQERFEEKKLILILFQIIKIIFGFSTLNKIYRIKLNFTLKLNNNNKIYTYKFY